MSIATLLAILTLAVVLVITLALALYLLSITMALRDATKYLDQLMDSLARIERETGSLDKNLAGVQGGQAQLLSTLQAANERLSPMTKPPATEERPPLQTVSAR